MWCCTAVAVCVYVFHNVSKRRKKKQNIDTRHTWLPWQHSASNLVKVFAEVVSILETSSLYECHAIFSHDNITSNLIKILPPNTARDHLVPKFNVQRKHTLWMNEVLLLSMAVEAAGGGLRGWQPKCPTVTCRVSFVVMFSHSQHKVQVEAKDIRCDLDWSSIVKCFKRAMRLKWLCMSAVHLLHSVCSVSPLCCTR